MSEIQAHKGSGKSKISGEKATENELMLFVQDAKRLYILQDHHGRSSMGGARIRGGPEETPTLGSPAKASQR
jgi:hypothetical protein